MKKHLTSKVCSLAKQTKASGYHCTCLIRNEKQTFYGHENKNKFGCFGDTVLVGDKECVENVMKMYVKSAKVTSQK